MYMLSTDIATCLIRGKSRTLDERVASVPSEELCISAVTRGELLLGVSRQMLQDTASELTPKLPVRGATPQGKVRDARKTAGKGRAEASPIDQPTMESLRKTTHAVLEKLTPREAKGLRVRFGIDLNIDLNTDLTLEKVLKQFDVTRERIRSMERTANISSVVDQFLTRVLCLPWDATAATHFATVAVELHRIGTPMGTTDTMVAGHAIAVGAVLVTNSEQRFLRVGGLKTEDWTRRGATQ
jgi:predicted nucleic acid-binding protein